RSTMRSGHGLPRSTELPENTSRAQGPRSTQQVLLKSQAQSLQVAPAEPSFVPRGCRQERQNYPVPDVVPWQFPECCLLCSPSSLWMTQSPADAKHSSDDGAALLLRPPGYSSTPRPATCHVLSNSSD